MRMWMIEPKLLCKNHLLGEHFEIHKAVGNLKHTGKWAMALVNKGYLEPQNFMKRHDMLVKEMLRRGYNHNSPLDLGKVKLPKGKVNTRKSISDLKAKGCECRVK
jgi:hypothetical protein